MLAELEKQRREGRAPGAARRAERPAELLLHDPGRGRAGPRPRTGPRCSCGCTSTSSRTAAGTSREIDRQYGEQAGIKNGHAPREGRVRVRLPAGRGGRAPAGPAAARSTRRASGRRASRRSTSCRSSTRTTAKVEIPESDIDFVAFVRASRPGRAEREQGRRRPCASRTSRRASPSPARSSAASSRTSGWR